MIELNSKTQQDFLNRELVQKLLDAGVDMSDAKYLIGKSMDDTIPWYSPEDPDYIYYKDEIVGKDSWYKNIGHIIEEVNSYREKNRIKRILFLPTYTVSELLYKLREKHGIYTIFNNLRNNDIDNTPIIESLASLLIQCHQKDIGMKTKDTGNISDK